MLEGKTVLVSGGTGYIGSAICRVCAENGAQVIFTYRTNESAAEALREQLPGAYCLQLDLADIDGTRETIESLYRAGGRIDVLVNNAGITQIMPFAMIEEDDFNHLMTVNVKGTFFLTKAVARGMIRNRAGAIVNIGSIAGHRMYDVPVHYALSKAAIPGFTYALAVELKRFGIRVNTVVPGLIEDGLSTGISAELKDDFNKHCAAGRPGTAREVADAVCFLASDRASYINGQNLFVDGGI
jgi:NAD(P)-dependent dehydrogenase (short-subunit alcohol dehydrogenase family)